MKKDADDDKAAYEGTTADCINSCIDPDCHRKYYIEYEVRESIGYVPHNPAAT